MKVPKPIKEATKQLDRERYELSRKAATRHWAIVEKGTGQVVFTLHANCTRPGGRGQLNQQASLRRAGLLKDSK